MTTPKKPRVGDTLFLITSGTRQKDPALVVRLARVAKVTKHFIYTAAHPEGSRDDLSYFLFGGRLHRTHQAKYIAFDVLEAVRNYLEFCDERIAHFAEEALNALKAQKQFIAQRDVARVMLTSKQAS